MLSLSYFSSKRRDTLGKQVGRFKTLIYMYSPNSNHIQQVENCILLFVLFLLSDQVLSITPKTQEQVDIVRNVSIQYQVELMIFFVSDCLPVFVFPCVNQYLTLFLSDSVMAAGLTSVHQTRNSSPLVCSCK